MDQWRLYCLISSTSKPGVICEGHKHILDILECACPPIERDSETHFDKLEERGDKMFFSQERLKKHFVNKPFVIDSLLKCTCTDCQHERGDPRDGVDYIQDVREKYAWLLLPIMIYLGKLHFVYPWIRASRANRWRNVNTQRKTHDAVECSQIASLESLLPNIQERTLFKAAYARVQYMFSPAVFSMPPKYVRYPGYARFPFQNGSQSIPQGQSGTVRYFEIPAEYVDDTVQTTMRDLYPSSVLQETNSYSFVHKVLKLSPQEDGMQRDVLRMVSELQSPNIITLLAFYDWRESLHYVFPHTRYNLKEILRDGKVPSGVPPSNSPYIRDHWLWREMGGVSEALSLIHGNIPNPFPGNRDRVAAFHFDMKPANILVTEDGKLKIADFGHSSIRLIGPGEQATAPWTFSDPIYMAPEAWHHDSETARRLSHTPAGEPREVLVLQNYDVWALACIMLEVLIFVKEGTSGLERFDSEREQAEPRVAFFDTNKRNVKDCVRQKATSVLQASGNDMTYDSYLHRVEGLLLGRGMVFNQRQVLTAFAFDMNQRITSKELAQQLQKANDDYDEARRDEQDLSGVLVRKIRGRPVDGYREVGWEREGIVYSFLTMNDVMVGVTIRSACWELPLEESNIQLLYRPASEMRDFLEPAQYALKWGLERQNQRTEVLTCIIDTETAHFVPSYIYQDEAMGYKCAIIGKIEVIRGDGFGQNRDQADVVMTVKFKSREDAQAFQGALLRHEVAPASGIHAEKAVFEFKQKKSKFLQSRPMHSDGRTNPYIQLWARHGPNYLPVERAHTRKESGAAMAVFGSRKALILMPLHLYIRDKQFHMNNRKVTVAYDHRGHRYFRLALTPPHDDGFEAPSIPLRENLLDAECLDQTREIYYAELVLNTSEDIKHIKEATGPEWKG